MSKHYNLTVTDDNGKSVTTSNTSTEHADEIMRMMALAGLEVKTVDSDCGCGESIEEAETEYKPTPSNAELELDDFSKKTADGTPKQKKEIQPSKGDNPIQEQGLEYSTDENEIFESLMKDFEEHDKS